MVGLTSRQAAELLKVNPGTIRNWISRGLISRPLTTEKIMALVQFCPQTVVYVPPAFKDPTPRRRQFDLIDTEEY